MNPLGYLFWHAPRAGVDAGHYEDACRTWQASLAGHPPAGYLGGTTWRLDTPPWLAGWPVTAYADLYEVQDYADLGVLAHDAVSGSLTAPHDASATLAGHGTAGLYRRMSMTPGTGPASTDGAITLTFVDKEAGLPYDRCLDGLAGPGRTVWMRQLTLGPGPELLVVTEAGSVMPDAAHWSASAVRI